MTVRKDADPGDDVSRTPSSGLQFVYVATYGTLEPGESFPSDETIAELLPEEACQWLLEREQVAADEFAARRRQEPR